MRSMTGFGSSRTATSRLELETQVKSVNGRYAEIRLHFPKEYAPLEGDVRKLVSQFIRRGTVDIYVSRRLRDEAVRRRVVVRQELARQWMKAYKQLAQELKLKDPSDASLLLSIPDVVQVEESFELLPREGELLLRELKKALKAHDRERSREGQALKQDMLGLLKDLEVAVKRMKQLLEKNRQLLRERYESRLASMGLADGVDPQRLAQEVVIQVDRTDIAEELTRLSEHVTSCRAMISRETAEGKKLDFYCQELLREVNTIGSKSQSAELTRTVVDAKSVVERFREQVQNAE